MSVAIVVRTVLSMLTITGTGTGVHALPPFLRPQAPRQGFRPCHMATRHHQKARAYRKASPEVASSLYPFARWLSMGGISRTYFVKEGLTRAAIMFYDSQCAGI